MFCIENVSEAGMHACMCDDEKITHGVRGLLLGKNFKDLETDVFGEVGEECLEGLHNLGVGCRGIVEFEGDDVIWEELGRVEDMLDLDEEWGRHDDGGQSSQELVVLLITVLKG